MLVGGWITEPRRRCVCFKNDVVRNWCGGVPMCPPRVPRKRSAAFVRALGAAIRARRMRLGLTRTELARRAHSTQSRIIAIEAGDPELDLLQLVAIAAALQISLQRLLRRAERRIGWVNPAGNGGATTKRQKPKQ